jgi:putative glutamine amidotransferase
VGRGLDIVAHADDGIIEAIEMKERSFVLGVQWHPERDYETNKPLFDSLVVAARARQVKING